MKINILNFVIITLIALVGSTPLYAQIERHGTSPIIPDFKINEEMWVAGKNRSCSEACSQSNARAVHSGTYKNHSLFYICRTNAHGEGQRAGYNLAPDWSDGCVVGWGGKEEKLYPYDCLCSDTK